MENPPWRETLSRSLGSLDAAELADGMCRGNGCQQETTRLHAISCTKTGWSSLIHRQVLHQALTRSLRESKVQFVVEDTWPFREKGSGQNGRLIPLHIDGTTEAGHSSTITLDARIRRSYSTLPSSTLALAPIWKMQQAMQENTSNITRCCHWPIRPPSIKFSLSRSPSGNSFLYTREKMMPLAD